MRPVTRGRVARRPLRRNEIIYYQYFSPACFRVVICFAPLRERSKGRLFRASFRWVSYVPTIVRVAFSLSLSLSLFPFVVTFVSTKGIAGFLDSRKDGRSLAVFAVCGAPVCFVRIFALIYLHIRSPWSPFRRDHRRHSPTPLLVTGFHFCSRYARLTSLVHRLPLASPPRVRNAFVFADYLGDSVLSAIAISSRGCSPPFPFPPPSFGRFRRAPIHENPTSTGEFFALMLPEGTAGSAYLSTLCSWFLPFFFLPRPVLFFSSVLIPLSSLVEFSMRNS